MYRYDAVDKKIVNERVAQFRDQVARWQSGMLSDDEFRPLRLQNGLYVQRHAPMLRVAIPYGMLSSLQLRKLAFIAETYDRGYGHFSTRQNIQFNWPSIADCPDILQHLADVEMHAIQTSGNCIRNITTDQFAGVAADEIIDPRPLAEILRQWSTFHPEFAYLPRKFKIAISGTTTDRAVTWFHDIGLQLNVGDDAEPSFRVVAGGGLGRTPIRGEILRERLHWQHLLTYCEAILRVYNRYGRRDNIYKARIKILLQALGVEKFAAEVEAEWAHLKDTASTITADEYARVAAFFVKPNYKEWSSNEHSVLAKKIDAQKTAELAFARWHKRNTHPHAQPGYNSVSLSLKKLGQAPGDITALQMRIVADLADRYSFGELRVTHEQNLILADVEQDQLYALWQELKPAGLATPNIGLLTDIICCPGGDFCDLANAKSIPIAQSIQARFDDLDYLFDLGEIDLNISGCINACGHHHVGNIGILGIDKKDTEFYQITLGGRQGSNAQLGKVIGPSFSADEVPDVIDKILNVYVTNRIDDELFLDTFDRIGVAPFKDLVYAARAHGKSKSHDNEVLA